jgi:hypothetical protein
MVIHGSHTIKWIQEYQTFNMRMNATYADSRSWGKGSSRRGKSKGGGSEELHGVVVCRNGLNYDQEAIVVVDG